MDALLVADVRVNAVEPRKMRLFGRHVQSGLGHHGQQSHGLQRYRLAASIGAGDQHHLLLPVQVDTDWDHGAGEQWMAGSDQFQAPFCHFLVGYPRSNRTYGCGITGLGNVQVKSGHQVQGQQQVFAGHSDHPRQLAQHPLDLPALGQPGLPPAVTDLDGRHGFDKNSRPAVGHVMDDAGHAVAHLGLDQQHHPAVALGDQRLLNNLGPLQATQVAFHDLVEPVLGLARLLAEVVQHWTGVVQHLTGWTNCARDCPLQVAQLWDDLRDARQHRYLFVATQFRPVVAGGPEQFSDQEQFLAAQ